MKDFCQKKDEPSGSSHKDGQRGSGKRITSKVRTYLEGFFLAGNVNKADRMSAKDMAMELKKLEGEIQNEEIPEIKTIEERYSANLRRESAERRVENNETNKRSFNRNDKKDQTSNMLEINKNFQNFTIF